MGPRLRPAAPATRPARAGLNALARVRGTFYRLFATLLLYPTPHRLAAAAAAARALGSCEAVLAGFAFYPQWRRARAALQTLLPGATPALEDEFVRLFLVRPEAVPCESAYCGAAAAAWLPAHLCRTYAEAGLALSPTAGEPPDGAAVELEFMAALCEAEAAAQDGDGIQILERQHRFLAHHLARWFPAFTQRVARAAPGGLYAAVTEAACAFVLHDLDLVDALCARRRP
jgi:TorA maturation chaperone TorD